MGMVRANYNGRIAPPHAPQAEDPVVAKLMLNFASFVVWSFIAMSLCPVATLLHIYVSTECSEFGTGLAIYTGLPAIAAPAPSIWRRGFSDRARLAGLLWGQLTALISAGLVLLLIWLAYRTSTPGSAAPPCGDCVLCASLFFCSRSSPNHHLVHRHESLEER